MVRRPSRDLLFENLLISLSRDRAPLRSSGQDRRSSPRARSPQVRAIALPVRAVGLP
jgi:hypothetical protein